ncbi:hypothetical protein BDZ97DRAFT_1760422 [Flammula alnicola]|nr:hypothetical protein BDZ97DRAFT_1760422 [Flammula alnicola]
MSMDGTLQLPWCIDTAYFLYRSMWATGSDIEVLRGKSYAFSITPPLAWEGIMHHVARLIHLTLTMNFPRSGGTQIIGVRYQNSSKVLVGPRTGPVTIYFPNHPILRYEYGDPVGVPVLSIALQVLLALQQQLRRLALTPACIIQRRIDLGICLFSPISASDS